MRYTNLLFTYLLYFRFKIALQYFSVPINTRHDDVTSSLQVKPKNRPGPGTQKLPYIPLQLSLINFLFTVPVQWPGMIDSASSDFTMCIKGPNIGSF